MSVLFSTYCIDCCEETNAFAGGYIGFPSLSTEKKPIEKPAYYPWNTFNEDNNNFGYIYEGFKILKLLTQDIEQYRAFLQKHQGHRVILVSDYNDDIPPEELKDPESITEYQYDDKDFVEASYQIDCKACGDRFSDSNILSFRDFAPFTATPLQIQEFDKYVLSGDLYLDHYGAGVGAEFLEILSDFLRQHKNHELVISLSAKNS